jgi:uncharacterized integral membrane protein
MHQNETCSEAVVSEKKEKMTYVLLLGGAMLLYILFVCLNKEFSTNIIYMGTMLSEITDLLYLGIEIFAFFIVYAYAIYTMFTYGAKTALRYGGIYAIITGARHVALYFVNWIFFGLANEDRLFQALMTLLGIALELCQYAVVFLAAYYLIRRYNRIYAVMSKGSMQLNHSNCDKEKLVFPYRKIPLKNDPFRSSAFISALFVGAKGILERVISEITYAKIDPSIGGAPKDLIDALWMILYYAVDIAVGVACYFAILGIIRRLTSSNETKE